MRFHANECRSRSVRPASLTRRAGAFSCESLEPRQLLSSLIYSDLAGAVKTPDATVIHGNEGPIAILGDIDGDGASDLLVGHQYYYFPPFAEFIPRNGAVVLSGKTGFAIRSHILETSKSFGWSVAALGDVDADGVPDYAIGTAAADGDDLAFVYSGKTGDQLYQIGSHDSNSKPGTTVARAGDVNADGHADFLVARVRDHRVTLYSGADGSALHTIDGVDAHGLLGGVDLNDDDISDVIISSLSRLTVYSGADDAILFSIDHPPAHSFLARPLHIESGEDFNQDQLPDLLVTTTDEVMVEGRHEGHRIARLYSGADGSLLHTFSGPDSLGLSSYAAIVDDIDNDGTRDIAATFAGDGISQDRADRTGGYFAGNAALLYSGADFSLLARLSDDSPASYGSVYVPVFDERSTRLALGYSVAMIDRDGDGYGELITAATNFSSPGSYADPDVARLLSFDGSKLGPPVFDGALSDANGKFIAWGHIAASGFLYRDGRLTYLSELEGFSINDRILQYRNQNDFSVIEDRSVIIVAPDGDPARARVWFGDRDLNYLGTLTFDQPITGTPPAGDYTFVRAGAITANAIYFEQTRDGTTPTTWRLAYTVSDRVTAGEMSYIIDGSLVGAGEASGQDSRIEQVVTIAIDDPSNSVVSLLGVSTTTLTGFRATAVDPRGLIVGVAQRGDDTASRPYTVAWDQSQSEFIFGRVPGLEDGSEWNPTVVTYHGVAGTYKDSAGRTSIFAFRFYVTGGKAFDPFKEELLGAPAESFENPVILGFGAALWAASGERAQQAQFWNVAENGPFLSPADASFAIPQTIFSQDGAVVVTRNAAGELLVYGGGRWMEPVTYDGDETVLPVYPSPFFGDIVTWNGGAYPSIALATDAGLTLIEPYTRFVPPLPGGSGPGHYVTTYRVRNLTTEIPGSKAITQSLVTLLPQNGLRLLAGLTADGELVMYGLTEPQSHEASKRSKWAYANLFDQVSRPAGIPDPVFDPANNGPLISYVTSWDGLNIAGVSNGEVISFWTAPAIRGWRYANISQSVVSQPAVQPFKNIRAYITPWGGMNIVGNDHLQVYWWTPAVTGWQTDRLVDRANGPLLRSETLTTFVSSWGGLNIAGLDENNRLWVYWWAPGQERWTAANLELELSEPDRRFPHAGRLAATVSATDETFLFSRTPFGNTIQYSWSPAHAWEAKPLL